MVYYVRSSQFWCFALPAISVFSWYSTLCSNAPGSLNCYVFCVSSNFCYGLLPPVVFLFGFCAEVLLKGRRAKCEISCSSPCLEWIKPKWNLWFTCSMLIFHNWLVVTAMVLFFPSDGYGHFEFFSRTLITWVMFGRAETRVAISWSSFPLEELATDVFLPFSLLCFDVKQAFTLKSRFICTFRWFNDTFWVWWPITPKSNMHLHSLSLVYKFF